MSSPNFGWHQILDYWEVLDYSASDLLHTQKIGQQRILDYCEFLDYSVCDYSEVRLYYYFTECTINMIYHLPNDTKYVFDEEKYQYS